MGSERERPPSGIAVLAMSCRAPGARSVEELWHNLLAGAEGISFFSPEELTAAGVPAEVLRSPSYVRAAGMLQDIDLFDAEFFQLTRREAEITDPQQRLFLECAWEALEKAGYAGAEGGTIGVYAGVGLSEYLYRVFANPSLIKSLGFFRARIGNDKDYMPTLTSYKLNLTGPSVSVQTACSTSLVAVHLGCQSLLNYECDLALAGGSSITHLTKSGYFYREGDITSPDGHCRAFDADAQGTVGADGVGVVLLKRLADALADGDPIQAVILGTAINNDGAQKIGFTAPSEEGQARVISEALAVAGISPASLSFVEAHGTGTALGDPIEVTALSRVFRDATDEKGFCALGSIKSNIGHLDTAAGVVGLIKGVLAVREGRIPPSLHFRSPNLRLGLEESPFYVNSEPVEWSADRAPRRAGVSSFGIGGTNAHAVLEEAPPQEPGGPGRPWQLLSISARTVSALEAATDRLTRHLEEHPDTDLADVAFTLHVGRKAFDHRRHLVCLDVDDARHALTGDRARLATSIHEARFRPVTFLFPGQGVHLVGVGAELYRTEAVYREEVNRCREILTPLLGFDPLRLLHPAPTKRDEAAERLGQTAVAQPVLFLLEYALARLWMSWSIEPQALIGHSLGEYTAACLAEVLPLEDMLVLVAERGRLMQGLPPGAMLAVQLSAEELLPRLVPGVDLAAVNAPQRCVAAGSFEAVAELEASLQQEGIACRRLQTSHAFHSALMEPAVQPFTERVRSLRPRPPKIPYLSNLTGTWITAEEATDPAYWGHHLRQPVRFAEAVAELCRQPGGIFLEVGPGRTLGTLVAGAAASQEEAPEVRPVILASQPLSKKGESEIALLLKAAGDLWLAGVQPDWSAFYAGQRRRRVELPTYPFERRRYWCDANPWNIMSLFQGEGLQAQERTVVAPQDTLAPAAGLQAAAPPVTQGRQERILSALGEIISNLVGVEPSAVDIRSSFLDIGVDSLLLIQASQAIHKRFGVKISLIQFLEQYPTTAAVAELLDRELLPEAFPAPPPPDPPAAALAVTPVPDAAPGLRDLAEQLEATARAIRRQLGSPTPLPVSAPLPGPAERPAPAAPLHAFMPPAVRPGSSGRERITSRQREGIEELIRRYNRNTGESKRLTQEHRPHLAENRASVGFRSLWKDLVYPLVGIRSAASHIWDADGREYVDLCMGFGVNLFGHSPEFVNRAVEEQLRLGVQVGPQSALAGEVARRISRMTGVERVAFANSGTEAVMAALRVARAVTGRPKIALFAGSYHGTSDSVLGRRLSGHDPSNVVPIAPGVLPGMIADLLVLDYGQPEALDAVRTHAGELAAVLVEPIQSRRPDLQPAEFLRELRHLTEERGIALIFDEVVSGFRFHPRGAQAWFDVKADLVAYGKVLGGGMPIGVFAGNARFLDAIDGGMWGYGDDSYPAVDKTFFAGTFCKHPLAMAAAQAVLDYIEADGGVLQRGLNQRTAALAAELNDMFQRAGAPLRVPHAGSLFRFLVAPEIEHGDLFPFQMIDRQVYVWEGNTCFLSTAHSEEDIARVVRAARESVEELQRYELLPGGGATVMVNAEPRMLAYPLTEGQHEIWVLSQLGEGASRAYNQSVALRLVGRCDDRALAAAVHDLVDRHEALRTTFSPEGEEQRVAPRLAAPLPRIDFSSLGGEARHSAVRDWLAAEARALFDLEIGPVARFHLLRLAEDEHILAVTIHHIVSDGWSFGVLISELGRIYASRLRGAPPRLQTPVQFREYAREAGAAHGQAADEAYWAELFSDPVPFLELPADRPRPPVRSFRGGLLSHQLGPEGTNALKRLGARQGATLFTTLLAGFAACLHRLSGQSDLVAGIHFAGQLEAGRDDLVGYCIHLLPVRSRIGNDLSMADFLRRLQREVSAASAHRGCSLGRLIRILGLPLDPGRPPLVPVTVNLDRSRPGLRFGDLTLDVLETHNGGAKFELALNGIETGDDLRLDLEYDADLFDASTAARWVQHLAVLLAAAAEEPGRQLSELPLLGPAEHHQLLAEWNDTQTFYEGPECLHELVEAQVERSPQAVAVVFEEEALTYRELGRRADGLAFDLRRLGVGPESLVGIFMERSSELVVALLAVLKAGGAYVPLDPDYPAQRLRFMVEDARPRVVLTQETLEEPLARLGLPPDVSVLTVGCGAGAYAGCEGSGRSVEVQPGHPAYLIYTSGSTGRPKGVVNHHRAICNRLLWMQEAYRLGPEDRVLQKTPFSFDVSVWEFFWPLLTGARLVVARPGGHRDAAYLAGIIESEGITTLHFVPSMLRAFLEAEEVATGSGLRRVICSGEALPPDLSDRCRERLKAALHNLYGPTEAAVDVTSWPADTASPWRVVPIGRPIANIHLRVLAPSLEPLPVGVPGELYLGGMGLARGYHGRPKMTAERFIPDPWSPGERLYRTGDRVRYLPDGSIDFLGRLDFQVKVRGFRIELQEIEAQIKRYPGVRDAVVMARGEPQNLQLAGYVVGEVPAGALRDWLRQTLPEYMVPAHFITMDELPLNANGKIDRRALPAPDPGSAAREVSYVAPRNPAESVLAELWAEVLGIGSVGVHENFFALGGDSIRAIQIAARARRTGLQIQPGLFFRHPTVARMASAIGDPEEVTGGPEKRTPLTPAQQRLLEQGVPPAWTALLELPQDLAAGVLDDILRSLTDRHGALRLRLLPGEEGWREDGTARERISCGRLDLATVPGERRATVLKEAAAALQESMDPMAGVLLRALRVDFGKAGGPPRLLVGAHRLAADRSSWVVLLEDARTAFRQLGGGKDPERPPVDSFLEDMAEPMLAPSDFPRAGLDQKSLDKILKKLKTTTEDTA